VFAPIRSPCVIRDGPGRSYVNVCRSHSLTRAALERREGELFRSLILNALDRYRALIYRKRKGQAMDRPALTATTRSLGAYVRRNHFVFNA
jgi:hypothetical protein